MIQTDRRTKKENPEQQYANFSEDFFQQTPESSFRKSRQDEKVVEPNPYPDRTGVYRRVFEIKPRNNIERDFFCPETE